MKTPVLNIISVMLLAFSQGHLFADDLPEMRPALLGHGPRSLVNLINLQSLMQRGQGNATVIFSCGVDTLGNAGGGEFYRGTPNSNTLGREVVERCDHAQFDPAVFHHNRVTT